MNTRSVYVFTNGRDGVPQWYYPSDHVYALLFVSKPSPSVHSLPLSGLALNSCLADARLRKHG